MTLRLRHIRLSYENKRMGITYELPPKLGAGNNLLVQGGV